MAPNEESVKHEGLECLPAIHSAVKSTETNSSNTQDHNINNNNVRITNDTKQRKNANSGKMTLSSPPSSAEPKTNKVNLKQYSETLAVYVAVLIVGCAAGLLGPTLVHVTILYETDTTAMSSVFVFLNIGYFLGALTSGILFDRLNPHLQDGLALLGLGLSLTAAPHMPNMYIYQVLIGIQGFCQGYIYSAVPGQIFALWEGNKLKGPALQTANTVWSVGCVISPYIALPFLGNLPSHCRGLKQETNLDIVSNHMDNFTNIGVEHNGTDFNESIAITHSVSKCDTDVTDVRSAFKVVGLAAVIGSVLFVVMLFLTGPSVRRKDCLQKTDDESKSIRHSSEKNAFQYSIVTVVTILYYFVICYTYLPSTYLATFVIQGLGWSVQDGPILTSFFTGSVGIGRVLCIPLIYFVPPKVMIPILVLTSTSSFITLSFAQYLNETIIRVCMITAGFGSSSMMSFVTLWMGQYVTINSFIGALLLMSASVSGFTGAYLVGFLLEYSHMWLIYVCIISCMIVIFLYIMILIMVKLFYKDNDESTENEKETLRKIENGDISSVLDSRRSLSRVRRETVTLYASHTSIC